MTATETLTRQAAQRDRWLQEVTQRLASDGRFRAGWLVGSLGRGDGDALSDIDLLVVIDDSHADAVLANCVEEVGRFGKPVWLKEVPGNAPEGGAYISVGFQATPFPIGVDWYWQPARQALFPADARALFEKSAFPRADPPASFAELMSRRPTPSAASIPDRPTQSIADRVYFFWAMVPIAAKYGIRGWDEKASLVLRGLFEHVNSLDDKSATTSLDRGQMPPLQKLRQVIDQMDSVMPRLSLPAFWPPNISYAHEIMRLVEELSREGWSRQ